MILLRTKWLRNKMIKLDVFRTLMPIYGMVLQKIPYACSMDWV